MKLYFLFLLMLLTYTSVHAQDSLTARDKNLMQTLSMASQDYKAFAKAIKDYQQKLLNVQKNSTLSFEQKKKAIQSLHQQRESYISTHLNQDQQDKFKTYLKNNEHHSQAYYKRQQQIEILKQKTAKRNSQ